MRFLRLATGTLPAVFAVAVSLAIAPTPAHATPVVAGSFLDAARGCNTADCLPPSAQTFGLNGIAAVTGDIFLDAGSNLLSFDLDVVFASMTTLSGSEDNGVAEVQFLTVNYAATNLTVIPVAGSFVIGPAMLAEVMGTTDQLDLGGTSVGGGSFDVDARVTGTCVDVGGNINCGFTFGLTGFDLQVGPTGSTQTRTFEHTIDLLAVPEPHSAALVCLGLAVLGARTRRQR